MIDLKIGCRYRWTSLTSSAIVLPSIEVEVWAQNAQMEALITWENFSLGVMMAKWVPVTELEPPEEAYAGAGLEDGSLGASPSADSTPSPPLPGQSQSITSDTNARITWHDYHG